MAIDRLSLTDQVAVVIGGTTGIGKTLSIGLAEAGAHVVASSRRQSEVDQTADEIERRDRKTLRLTSDVLERASLERVRAEVLAKFGRVDILINCAGRTLKAPALDVSDADWNAVLETNLTGTFRSCQTFGRPMLEQGRGRIINIASLSSFVALYQTAAYSASKAGVVSLTQTLAVEWGPRGVNVNAIAPGVFRTALNPALLDGTERGKEFLLRTPMRRFGKLEELIGAAIFLSSESASFVNGEVLTVDGGVLASGVNQYETRAMPLTIKPKAGCRFDL
ncbi:MAG: SDR family oxidoreductase, partial [Deltaproteobacteria bacterium]|nr:SDR family oxidoreductase [Deltaproteobacteria bacterium]